MWCIGGILCLYESALCSMYIQERAQKARKLIPVNIKDRGVPDLYAACVAAGSDGGALSKRSKSSCMAFLQTRTYLWSRADKYGCSYDSIEPDGPCALW